MRILTVSIITGISADWTSLATYDPTYDISTQDYNQGNVGQSSRYYRDSNNRGSSDICNAPGLTPTQQALCKVFPEEARFLQMGSRMGKQECQTQLKDSTWNCPAKVSPNGFSFKTKRNTKEEAFGKAVLAAAGMKMLATGCAMGEIENCNCKNKNRRDNSGRNQQMCASEAIEFGYQWSKQFIDQEFAEFESNPQISKKRSSGDRNMSVRNARKSKRRDEEQRMLALYNAEAGRVVAKNSAKVTCKCHGVSGTCSTKTCNNKIDKFGTVAKNLVNSYKHAKRVRLNPRTHQLEDRKNKRRVYVTARGEIMNVSADRNEIVRLVYTRRPTDWCKLDDKGRYFNAGRTCRDDVSESEETSCEKLCCGHGHYQNIRTVKRKCHCKLGDSWEKLVCDTCEEEIRETLCRESDTK